MQPHRVAIVKMPDSPKTILPVKNWKKMFAGREFEVRYHFDILTHNAREFLAPNIERIRRLDKTGKATTKGPQYDASIAEVHEATLEAHIKTMVDEAHNILLVRPGNVTEVATDHFWNVRVKVDLEDAKPLARENIIVADVHEETERTYIIRFHVHAFFDGSPVTVTYWWNLEEDGMEDMEYHPDSPETLKPDVLFHAHELFNVLASSEEKDVMVKIYNREED